MKRKPDVLVVLALCFAIGAVVTLVAPWVASEARDISLQKTTQAGVSLR